MSRVCKSLNIVPEGKRLVCSNCGALLWFDEDDKPGEWLWPFDALEFLLRFFPNGHAYGSDNLGGVARFAEPAQTDLEATDDA